VLIASLLTEAIEQLFIDLRLNMNLIHYKTRATAIIGDFTEYGNLLVCAEVATQYFGPSNALRSSRTNKNFVRNLVQIEQFSIGRYRNNGRQLT